MRKSLLDYKGKGKILKITLAFSFLQLSTVFAHNPHDVIDFVELSPTYDQDKTVIFSGRHRLFKSTDGGYSWKQLVNGFQTGYDPSPIAISPSYQEDRTVFSSFAKGGIRKSIDGGLSWHLMNNELMNRKIPLLSISPEYFQDRILMVADEGGALYKTINGGKNFQKVHDGAKIQAIAFSSEVKTKFICVGDAEGVLFISDDSGDSWHRKARIFKSGGITSIAVSSSLTFDKTIVIGTASRGVFISLDGGASFQNSTYGISDKYICSVAMSPKFENDSMIFVSTWNAVYGSNDRGKTWKKSIEGLTTNPQANTVKYKVPHFRALRISKSFDKDQTLFVAGFDGLFKSDDGAQSWMQVETRAASNIRSLSFSPAYKEDSTIVITTYKGGIYISKDRGVNWEVRNRGLYNTRVLDVILSPNFASDCTIYACTNRRFYKSTNEGQNWQASGILQPERGYWGLGLRRKISSKLSRMGLPDELLLTRSDILSRRALFPLQIVISPKFEADHTIFFGTRYQGIFRSIDGGLNWSSPFVVGNNGWVTSLVISPDFRFDKTLFASVRDEGIYKSIDRGETWRMVYESKDPRIFVAVSPHFRIDKTVFAGISEEGLVKTTDAGDIWEKVGDSCCGENTTIKALAISPNYEKDKTIIVSVEGIGLFKSQDGAGSFVEIGTELINKNHNMKLLRFSPVYQTDNTIFGASDEELFRSMDAGKTWNLLKRSIRYEEKTDYIRYEGRWDTTQNESFSAMKAKYSDVPTSRAKFIFVGTGISWIGSKGNDKGIAKVFLDGKLKQLVNQFSSRQEFMVPIFAVDNLTEEPHSITIEITNKKHPKSSGYQIAIDAFDVTR